MAGLMPECQYIDDQKKCPSFDENRQNKKICLHFRFNEYCIICSQDKSYKPQNDIPIPT